MEGFTNDEIGYLRESVIVRINQLARMVEKDKLRNNYITESRKKKIAELERIHEKLTYH